jgi:hypothetical protein
MTMHRYDIGLQRVRCRVARHLTRGHAPCRPCVVHVTSVGYRPLRPYLLELARNVSAFGALTMRSLTFEFLDDPATVGISDEYLLGPRFLVVRPARVEPASSRSTRPRVRAALLDPRGEVDRSPLAGAVRTPPSGLHHTAGARRRASRHITLGLLPSRRALALLLRTGTTASSSTGARATTCPRRSTCCRFLSARERRLARERDGSNHWTTRQCERHDQKSSPNTSFFLLTFVAL